MWWLLTSFFREILDWIFRKILDWIFRNPGKMAIKQCYRVRAVNLIFNLLSVQSSGAGSSGTWQICCVCSDQPCLSSKVYTRNVLSLLFLVADSAFSVRLSPSSSSCCAELSLTAGLDCLVLTDRQKLSKGRLTPLKPCCFCRLGPEPDLALSTPSTLPGKATNFGVPKKLSFSELVLFLAWF